MSGDHFVYKLDKSAIATVIGIVLLFSSAIIVTLAIPMFVDDRWVAPSSDYQVQMYEVADPNIYISTIASGRQELQTVYHLKAEYTLLAFEETEQQRIVASPELEPYITRYGETELKLSSDLMLLRKPKEELGSGRFNAKAVASQLQNDLQSSWERDNPDWQDKGLSKPRFEILELYRPDTAEVFAVADSDGITENWVDEHYRIIDKDSPRQDFHQDKGVLYVRNPIEYRVRFSSFAGKETFSYDAEGEAIQSVDQLKADRLGFVSRAQLIRMGEDIFRIEGCWYCHTDQTRSLIQDTVLNGAESYPAPPSSPNEYVYQKVTFPGTRRIGPDISRVGVKRPSRDWHKSHFWSPKTASAGTIMPAFRHFFDDDPRGTAKNPLGVPNYQFEAIYQYLMTKGTRITPPTQAWWLGKDPVKTKDIIEGRPQVLAKETGH